MFTVSSASQVFSLPQQELRGKIHELPLLMRVPGSNGIGWVTSHGASGVCVCICSLGGQAKPKLQRGQS